MCGISGILDLKGAPVELAPLKRMIAALRHRGPDETGFYRDQQVGLGHARLSIIDLSGGRQPMCNEESALCITFNGEIFNYIELREELIRKGYRFRTRSDTEVVLHLYEEEGESCVNRLNGQWAFAIWDAAEQKLFLSRDRLGVRPLFYTQTASQFLFASEIKALLTNPELSVDLDLISLSQIFAFWVSLPSRTAFKGISQLPPAHSLTIEKGRLRVWRYWQFEYEPENEMRRDAEKQCAEELCSLLIDATRIRLRSDVPVGTYLSGGLDSSLVTALTCSLAGERLRSFGISFDDAALDESGYQQQVSEALGIHHTNVHCSRGDIANIFPAVIHHTEQPIIRTAPAPMYLLARRVRESGYKVVLTGEGADEMFGGYDIFKEAKIRRFWSSHPESMLRPLLLRRLYPYMAGIQAQPDAYLRHFFQVEKEDLASPFFSHLPRWQSNSRLSAFFSDDLKEELRGYDPIDDLMQSLPSKYSKWHYFCQAQYLEAAHLLPGYILSSQGDRMAMAHSVECRYPFLDYRVVEFAGKLHPSLKMRVLNEKYLLKQVARQRLPRSVIQRAKQPYRAPEAECFVGEQSLAYFDDLTSSEKIRDSGIFHSGRTSSLIKKGRSGRAIGVGDNMAIIGILSTQLLVDEFVGRRLEDIHASCEN